MKLARSRVRRQARALPALKFENHALTSFAGLVVFQKLFASLDLKTRLRRCFRGRGAGKAFGPATIFLQLIVHLILGFRELCEAAAYRDDPMVQRLLGLQRLPDVATLSRMLKNADARSVRPLRRLLAERIFQRITAPGLTRLTLDFDGSVQSTRRHAEGTAVGYNRKRKGQRSDYPLFCTIAQTHPVLDFLHRPGNVHDAHGAREFILACVHAVRQALPHVIVEVRMDSAFFSDGIVSALQAGGVEFTLSVPFERFTELKAMIENRRRWRPLSNDVSYFEADWKPQVRDARFRFLFSPAGVPSTRAVRQNKEPIQLDLFVPHEYGHDFKVIVTNKTLEAGRIVAFHEGRGSQEGIFGELKTNCHMDDVPVRTRAGNQLDLLAGLFAHNLTCEPQMAATPPQRHTTPGRAALWAFEKLRTLRNILIHRAGRFTRPQHTLTLTLNANAFARQRLLDLVHALQTAKHAA